MKKTLILTLTLLFVYSVCFAGIKAPTDVNTAFNEKFPNATKVKWDKENNHEFEAAFKFNGEKYTASFSDKGDWLETEKTISFSQLPEKVQLAVKSSYKSAKIKAVAKIENSKGEVYFEIEMKHKSKTFEKFFSSDGSEIKK